MAKKTEEAKPKLNPNLQGFDIRINSFGEIVPNWDLSRLNEFLDKNVPDKKLVDRPDHVNRRPEAISPETDAPKPTKQPAPADDRPDASTSSDPESQHL